MRLSRRKKICYPTFAKFNKHPQKSVKKLNWKYFVWGGFFVFALAGAIYLLVFSSVFRITIINVSGNNILEQEQVVRSVKSTLTKKILKFIPADTIFALANNKIKNNLLEAFPEIETLQIKRTKMNELEITLSERKPGGILCLAAKAFESLSPSPTASNQAQGTSTTAVSQKLKETLPESAECFFVDETGYVYREAPEISGTLLPTFYSYQEKSAHLKAQGVETTYLKFAAQVKKELRQAGIDMVGFVLSDEVGLDLRAFSSEGWFVYFDPTRVALTQAKILEAILQDEIKDKRATLQYVDLRVEDRVYYK